MVTSIIGMLCMGGAYFFGFAMGHVRGYDKASDDDRRIKQEMDELWEEAGLSGSDRSYPFKVILGTKR